MRVTFIGTGEIGVPSLRFLRDSSVYSLIGVVTQPDKPVGRAQKLTPPPIKSVLLDSTIPILQPPRIKAEDAIAGIRAWQPDLIVVMAYGQILPRAVLEIPRLACLNLHASLLPRWRGAAPIQAAIAAGDSETGITVMYMDEGLDTGDELLQRRLPIAPSETGGSLHDKLAGVAAAALADALSLLVGGTASRVPQDAKLASYAAKLERENGRIDWKESAAMIERRIRAFDPWPGSFTTVYDRETQRPHKMKIFRATALPSVPRPPGEIIETIESGFLVSTGDGALSLLEVQIEGKQRMSASDFVRGHRGLAERVG
ncbi:MAG: methionyl-tRNA formyltransferase [Verrucomicrobiota bacterium]|nr:methionyl-tRNA formyltransferase [Verrucomicrobiota bacterium]